MQPKKYHVVFLVTIIFSKCHAEMEPYIVGGFSAKIREFPHSVFLTVSCNMEKWICGASVLNQNLLLTAGHCFEGCHKRFNIEVLAGHENLLKTKVRREAKNFVIHSSYDPKTLKCDIAIANLRRSLPMGYKIKRVIISKYFPKVNKADVTGWGVIDDTTGDKAVELKILTQTLQPTHACTKFFSMYPGMICAGSRHSKIGPSEGDSGGALVTSTHQQIGIVSSRSLQYPGLIIYTNVSFFYSWIQKKAISLVCH